MNKQEALVELQKLQRTTACADDVDSVGLDSDIEPVERLAKQLGIYSGEVKKTIQVIYDRLAFNHRGYRLGITWVEVYDMFNAMEAAIEAMP